MKRFWTIVIFSAIAFSGFCQYSVVQVDGLALISSSPRLFRASVEKGIGEKFSAVFSGEFGTYIKKSAETQDGRWLQIYTITGLGAMGQFRYFPFRRYVHSPLGTFVGTHLRAKSVKENYDPDGFDITTFGFVFDVGAHAGYKLNSNQWTLEVLFGAGKAFGNFVEPNIRDRIPIAYTEELNEFLNFLRMELSIGYVFPELKMKKKKRDYVIG